MRGVVATLALLLVAAGADAQQRPARPPVRPDSARADTARAKPPTPQDLAADSVIRALRGLSGYTTTEYQANAATYTTDEGVLRLKGEAQVNRSGDRLTADTIEYRERSQLIRAFGKPEVAGQSQDLKGNVLFYDLATRRATAIGAETKVSQGANWIVRGDVTAEEETSTIYATHGAFTTCDLEVPHYHFEADRIKVVRDKYLVARPARLYFGKVPVMVLPFIVQSLEKGRRSGLLVPKFSLTDIVRNSSGHNRQISDLGWYWAINDYLGAQVTGTWRSGAYTSLAGSLDYRWRRQFLDGRATFQRYWESNGGRQFALSGNTSWRPDERTNMAVSGNYATSSRFIRQATFDPREATQNLGSSLNLSRRFDWGNVSLGGSRQQQISDGSVTLLFPQFSLSPTPITLFRSPTPEQASWYSNSTLTWGLSGTRTSTTGRSDFFRNVRDDARTSVNGGLQSLTIGKLSLSATGTLNQTVLNEVIGIDSLTQREVGRFPRQSFDVANWQASAGFQQNLIGQTVLTPNIGLSQELRRDTLTGGQFLQAPTRANVGVSLSTALFGFYPGVGPFSAIRHRITPNVGYSYSPQVRQTELQDSVFGVFSGSAQNIVTLSFSQTWEAKLKAPRTPNRADTLAAATATDTAAARQSVPAEPQKVTLLSINTSAFQYDFTRAGLGQSGFLTTTLSNSISSDYLRGLNVQVQHELFDQSKLDPTRPSSRGQLGTFSPRLSQLSTGFDLGPNSAIFRWLGLGQDENQATQGVMPGAPPSDRATAPGSGSFTGNPQAVGGGAWRAGFQYAFTRQPRTFFRSAGDIRRDRFGRLINLDRDTEQTLLADMAFSLTPNWAVTWNTAYSITDGQFSGHRLNFKRDLHRWQANFNFYQTPDGNTAFEFYVELIDNRDLKFNYRDYNLGIDRR